MNEPFAVLIAIVSSLELQHHIAEPFGFVHWHL